MEKKTPEKVQKKQNRQVNKIVTREFFEGPIPHPSILSRYEQIFPGAAKQILEMAERQSAHRQKLEAEIVHSDITNEKRGMNYSLIITLALLLIGAMLLILGKDTAGYFSLFGPSVFHAGNYIYKKLTEDKQLKDKEQEAA